MIEKGIWLKLRFPYKGECSIEDLTDLSVKELSSIYVKLNKELKESTEESLLKESKGDDILQLKIDILKHIARVKQDEEKEKTQAAHKALQKKKLLKIYAEKKDAEILSKTPEEIEAMIEAL
jgi:hypothetical protein